MTSPRKNIRLSVLLLATLSLSLSAYAQFGGAADNLVKNGEFSESDDKQWPLVWSESVSHPAHLQKNETVLRVDTEGDNQFLHIERMGSPETAVAMGSQTVALPPGAKSLRLAARMRGHDVAAGPDFWMLPGISVTYLFEDGTTKSGDLNKWLLTPRGDSEWTEFETIVPVKDGAPKASIAIIGQGWTGSVDIDDVVVEVVE